MSAIIKFTCLKASLVAAFLLILQVSFAQKKAPKESPFPLLDKAIEEKQKVLGGEFTVLLLAPDSLIYEKLIGDPAEAKTPVPIGAASGWLTTALLLQLADEGKISLDDPVVKYLPVFESYRKNFVTIRHCLIHQTGLGKEGFTLENLLAKKKFSSLEEAVTEILKKEVHANAGEQFRYSNYGSLIAARVAEVVTKKKFDQLIRTKLLVPLGMRSTTFTSDDGSAPDAAAGARSTAGEYGKFLQMLLNGGKVGEKQILSTAAIDEMRKLTIPSQDVKSGPKAAQGYGFALGSWADEGAAGAKANLLLLPSLNGTWAMVDFSQHYAFLVFARKFSGEQQKEQYLELKKLIDTQLPGRR